MYQKMFVNRVMEVEIITISKNVLNCDFDQNIYCFRQIVLNRNLKLLFIFRGYFVYHRQFNFTLSNSSCIVKECITNYLSSL